jgi:hypothetical protein
MKLTSKEWLAQYDANRPIHTISMGGLGPGYEQCIQMLVAEFLRSLVTRASDASAWRDDKDAWKAERAQIEADSKAVLEMLNPSGAQFGAAMNLATNYYMRSPQVCIDEIEADRRIMVQKEFPRAP